MEEGEFLCQNVQRKFRAPGENQTHDSRSSRQSALTTELLEAPWRVGPKFNHNYNSHRGLYRVTEEATAAFCIQSSERGTLELEE